MSKQKNIVFAHSNGFNAKTYSYFLEQLHPYPVTAVEKFATGKHANFRRWSELDVELIAHIEATQTQPVVGIGHSFGAAILFFAAQKRPDLFSKIILIEPPMFNVYKRSAVWLFTKLKIADNFSPAKKSIRRQDIFESRATAYESLRKKGIFRTFDENCFQDYIRYGLKDTENGVVLDIPRTLETRIFQSTPVVIPRKKLQMPAHFIYSNQFQTLTPYDIKWWKRNRKEITFHEFDGGHMFPLEKPEKTAIFLKSLLE